MALYNINLYVRQNAFFQNGNYDAANATSVVVGVSDNTASVVFDSSIIDSNANLLDYLPDYSGDLPFQGRQDQVVEFVGWSRSNTYVVSAASVSTDVTSAVLDSLKFSDLQPDPDVVNLYAVLKYSAVPDFYDQAQDSLGRTQDEENKLVNTALTKYPAPYLSGLKLNEDVVFNDLVLNKIDDNGVVWVVTDIIGWWTLPEPELPDLPRGWGDGSYDAKGRWANRIITLNGSFMPQRPEDAAAARNELIQAANLIKTGGWLIVYEDGTNVNGKAAYVRLSGSPQITSVNARGRHDFSIGLKAVDPIKYEYVDGNSDGYNSTTITLGGQATIENTGNVPVPVVFALTGGVGASDSNYWSIINNTTAESINLVSSVSSSDVLEIDTYNREIIKVTPVQNGDDIVVNARNKAEVLVDWMYLEPGNNVIKYETDNNTVSNSYSCQILWRSGWIG